MPGSALGIRPCPPAPLDAGHVSCGKPLRSLGKLPGFHNSTLPSLCVVPKSFKSCSNCDPIFEHNQLNHRVCSGGGGYPFYHICTDNRHSLTSLARVCVCVCVCVCACVTPNHRNQLISVRYGTSPLYNSVRTAAMFGISAPRGLSSL